MKITRAISLALSVMSFAAVFALAQAPPVTFHQLAELTASDGGYQDQFGFSVAMNENILVVGAPQYGSGAGKAYVYVKPAAGWASAMQVAELTPSDGALNLGFGYRAAISGRTIVINAGTIEGSNLQAREYVFVEPESGWASMTETAQLVLPNGGYLENIAIFGNTIAAVGSAPDGSESAVYLFFRPRNGWTNNARPSVRLSVPFTTYLGYALALNGKTVVATTYDTAAYVFVKPADGWVTTATPTATLSLSDETGADAFGASAAISGKTIVIGAPETGSNQEYYGAAYLYYEPGNGWVNATESAEIQTPNFQTWGFFGDAIASAGSLVVIGANGENVGSFTLVGAIFVYEGTSQIAELTPSDAQQSEEMGWSVSASGDVIAAGAVYATGSNGQRGTVYVFGP